MPELTPAGSSPRSRARSTILPRASRRRKRKSSRNRLPNSGSICACAISARSVSATWDFLPQLEGAAEEAREVGAERPLVGDRHLQVRLRRECVEQDVGLRRPPAVDRLLADAGARRDAFDCQRAVAGFRDQFERGGEDRLPALFAALAAGRDWSVMGSDGSVNFETRRTGSKWGTSMSIALVAGGTSGIGLATARRLQRAGLRRPHHRARQGAPRRRRGERPAVDRAPGRRRRRHRDGRAGRSHSGRSTCWW